MKTILVSSALALLIAGLAGTACAQYPFRRCVNNNSKACQDARKAFAEHHDGLTPEQYFNGNYQGQAGRWEWENADGDDWFDGRKGHWYKEPEGWRYRDDDGDEYRKGDNGWGWIKHREEHEEHAEKHERGHHDHD